MSYQFSDTEHFFIFSDRSKCFWPPYLLPSIFGTYIFHSTSNMSWWFRLWLSLLFIRFIKNKMTSFYYVMKKKNTKSKSSVRCHFFEGVENMFHNYQLIFNRVQKEKVTYYSSTNQNESSSWIEMLLTKFESVFTFGIYLTC